MLIVSENHKFDTRISDIRSGQVFAVIDAGEKAVGHYLVNRFSIEDKKLFQRYSNKIAVTNIETGRLVFKPVTLMVHKLNVKMVYK